MTTEDAAILRGRAHTGRLPVVQQVEVSECGLACLTMVARFHGHDVDLASLRRRFSSSIKGASLPGLMVVADKLGFESRPLRVELDYLREVQVPCILHWDLNHFVVLKRAGRQGVEIHDPARGALRLSWDEVSHSFTGIALALQPAPGFQPIRERRRITMRALAGKVYGLPKSVALLVALALALEIFTLALPLAMQWVLDHVLVSADLDLLTLLGIGFLAVVAFQTITMAMRGWVIADLGASMNAQWMNNLFGHLLRLPMPFFEKRHIGGIMSRFGSLRSIQHTLSNSFVEALLDGLTVTLVLIVLALYSPMLTMLVIGAFTLYLAFRWLAFRRLRRLNEEELVYGARQESTIIESVRGIQAIKLANRQGERRARVANATVEVANRQAKIQRLGASFSALSTLIFGSQRVLLIWIGAYLALSGQFTAGMLVVFVMYAEMFSSRASTLVDRVVELRLLGLHGERIADIALEAPERDQEVHYAGPAPEPTIEIDKLSFRYAEDEPWVLHDLSCRFGAGESVAIVGPSGCGKSTLAKLLLGLLEPTSGVIRVGGIDMRHLGLTAYRDLFAAVMQNDDLFAGSLADNISFFDQGADLAALESAARTACIHDDIVAMPMGYETLVGDMGSALSGGQKQRVLLARAVYRKPAILVLDEATSALEVSLEQEVNRAITKLDLTRIIIAHRPDTIASADRILDLGHGDLQPRAPGQGARPAVLAESIRSGIG